MAKFRCVIDVEYDVVDVKYPNGMTMLEAERRNLADRGAREFAEVVLLNANSVSVNVLEIKGE